MLFCVGTLCAILSVKVGEIKKLLKYLLNICKYSSGRHAVIFSFRKGLLPTHFEEIRLLLLVKVTSVYPCLGLKNCFCLGDLALNLMLETYTNHKTMKWKQLLVSFSTNMHKKPILKFLEQ